MTYACGWSLLLVAVFYWVVDVKMYRRWAFFFVVIGMNAITLYVLAAIVNFHHIAQTTALPHPSPHFSRGFGRPRRK